MMSMLSQVGGENRSAMENNTVDPALISELEILVIVIMSVFAEPLQVRIELMLLDMPVQVDTLASGSTCDEPATYRVQSKDWNCKVMAPLAGILWANTSVNCMLLVRLTIGLAKVMVRLVS